MLYGILSYNSESMVKWNPPADIAACTVAKRVYINGIRATLEEEFCPKRWANDFFLVGHNTPYERSMNTVF